MRSLFLTFAVLFVAAGLAVAQSSDERAGQGQNSNLSDSTRSSWVDQGSINSDPAAGAQANNANETPNVTPSFAGTETEKAYQEAAKPKNREGFAGFYDPNVTLSSPWNGTN